MTQATLLIVDDELMVRSALKRLLRQDGYQILDGGSAGEGLALLAQHTVQVVLSDQRMPRTSGTEFLGQVKALYPHTTRLLLSGHAEQADVADAIKKGGVHRYLTKSWDNEALRRAIRDAFSWQAESENSSTSPLAATTN
ncbi:MAG TPA: response regulator [Burkholderiaceae bacterium]|nr:response regulator [Burkholderiaceae bacterium]